MADIEAKIGLWIPLTAAEPTQGMMRMECNGEAVNHPGLVYTGIIIALNMASVQASHCLLVLRLGYLEVKHVQPYL